MSIQEAPIIIVEDDGDIRKLLELKIGKSYPVRSFSDGKEALLFIESASSEVDAQLFILDRMLPYASGEEICSVIRKHPILCEHPILMLTALSAKNKVMEGFEAGADDYLSKPFDLDELMARINALTRRFRNTLLKSQNIFEYKKLRITPSKARVTIDSEEVFLTKSEYLLLLSLMKERDQVMSREDLIQQIQGEQTFVTKRTVDTHMASLRKKIRPYQDAIETVRGIGYRFKYE